MDWLEQLKRRQAFDMYIQYPIIIEKGNQNTAWGISVPDIEGCFSASDEEVDILVNAREAILAHLEFSADVPVPSKLSDHINNVDSKHYVLLVDIDLSKLTGPAKRINITIPQGVLAQIDIAAKNSGKSRSAFLTEAAMRSI